MKTFFSALALSVAGITTSTISHAVQQVDVQNVTRNGVTVQGPVFVAAGDRVKFDAVLSVNGSSGSTTGLGLCLEFASSIAGVPVIGNVLQNSFIGQGSADPVANCHNSSSTVAGSVQVPGSDTTVITTWVSLNGQFPGSPPPVKLYDAQFTMAATPVGTTAIGFAASSVAAGETFATNGPLALCGKPTVAVAATANGTEANSVSAVITITLSRPIPAACGLQGGFPVTLTLSGTASVPGGTNADYTIGGSRISGSGATITATFPADGASNSISFSAKPVADNVNEGTETLVLTVSTGNGNYLGVGASATATIAEAGVPAATVVEYLNTADFPESPGGHYFYSSDPAEQAAVDAGAAGRFNRTGRTFKTGGTSPVCRFYGSMSPGPNSHFFTVNQDECNALKAMQRTPTPTDIQQWNYERIEYNTTPPVIVNGQLACPAGTNPLYRAYNNAFSPTGVKNPWDSNHRFSPVQADITQLVQQFGWRNEGLQFCTAQ